MPIDPRAKRLLDLLAAAKGSGSGADVTPAARRAALDQLADLAAGAPPHVAEVRDLVATGPDGPLPLRLYDPSPGQTQPAILFFHGGGWTAGSLKTHDVLCRTLALHADCKLVAVDYRQPPEHPYPAPVEDGWAALDWLAGQACALHIDAAKLCVAGDSAGAHIAAELVLQARDAHRREPTRPRIALQLLICPILDPAGALPSRQAFRDGYFIDPDVFAHDRDAYFGPGALSASLLASTDLRGSPPTLIHAAEFDPFRDEALAYAEQLAASDVEVHGRVHPGLVHYFYALTGAIPAGRRIVEDIGKEVGTTLAALKAPRFDG
jgi:acetyl esterase